MWKNGHSFNHGSISFYQDDMKEKFFFAMCVNRFWDWDRELWSFYSCSLLPSHEPHHLRAKGNEAFR